MADENPKSADARPKYDWLLFHAAFVYYFLNVLTVAIASDMHPFGGIWNALLFWIFCAPPYGGFIICFIQAACPKRPFTWLAITAFLVSVGVNALLNVFVFGLNAAAAG